MPVLLVDIQGITRGTLLPPRLLIGRRSMNHLVIDDATVSRMHAWIDQRGSDYYLTDMRSRTGTRVNGQPLAKRRKLASGDVIEIGPARLTFQLGDTLPAGIERLDLPREPVMIARDVGIRFDCPHCRAPMWASAQYAGHGGICTYCGEGFTIPRTIVNPTRPTATTSPVVKRPLGVEASAAATPTTPTTTQAPQPGESTPPARPVVTPTTTLPIPVYAPSAKIAARVSPSTNDLPVDVPAASSTSESTKVDAVAAPVVIESPPSTEVTWAAFDSNESPSITGTATRSPIFDAATTFVPADPETYTEPPSVPGQYKCGVCHSPIHPGESMTSCPSCNLRFHEECWQENYGCSAYGCPQVNALAPPPDPSAEAPVDVTAIDDDDLAPPPRTPWEFVLLGLSAVAVVLSGFTFGAVSLVMLIVSAIYLSRSKNDPDRKAGPLWGAIALSVAGVAAGAAVSYFLFLYGKH